MSFNLVDLVKGQLGGPALGQLGTLLGEDNNKTEAALGAAVPGLLSGLTSAANADGGASLFNAVKDQDDSMLDNIGGLLTGGNSSSVMNQGSSMLGSILGNGAAGGLASAVAGLSGIGGKSSSGLMGLLMPIVLGIVKRKVFGGGGFSQNAGGLLSLLNGQKDNVQAAMPSGFQNQLQSSGFMDQISGLGGGAAAAVGGAAAAVGGAAGAVGNAAGNVAGAAGNVAGNVAGAAGNAASNVAGAAGNAASNVAGAAGNAAGNTADAAGRAASGGGGFLRKLLPIAALAAIALFALKLCSGKDVEVPNASVPSVEVPSVDVGGMNVGDEIGGIFGGATEAISGVTDVDSAKAAVPALESVTGKVDGLSGIWDKVPEDNRGALSGLVGSNMDKLTPMLDKANEIPGVADVLGPVTGPLLEKLKAFM